MEYSPETDVELPSATPKAVSSLLGDLEPSEKPARDLDWTESTSSWLVGTSSVPG